MSEYYKPNRGAGWNYGGKNWKLSRSKIDLSLEEAGELQEFKDETGLEGDEALEIWQEL